MNYNDWHQTDGHTNINKHMKEQYSSKSISKIGHKTSTRILRHINDPQDQEQKKRNHKHRADKTLLFTYDAKYKIDRKSTRLNSSHVAISYAVFCLKKKK